MVIKLDKKIEVIKLDEPLRIPENLQSQINELWGKQIEKNPHLFNGEVWSVSRVKELPDKIKIAIQKTSYAHYLFDERVGIEGKFACYNLNCGILLETKDGYYIIGEMDETTSYPNGLQISGGTFEQNDIDSNGMIDIIKTISRELKEELNIDLLDESMVKEYKMQYMEIPQGNRHSYAPIMKGILNLPSKQMEEHYNNYKKALEKENKEIEFSRLHFIKKEKALETLNKLSNPKRLYLEGLIAMDSKRIENVER